MGAQIREYRQRIRSVSATKKITRAMELIAASRIIKAQQRAQAAAPPDGGQKKGPVSRASYFKN